ncbi:MAG: glucose-1-phosphate adenylyltransferase subunit GlgD [Eubacteriales bacterium]|nr:glucose-1-phosphate adenylyltransferase subunit GlgD [Eubacteriales bacterium]
MVNSNMNTLGIIFPNSYDLFVPDLVNVRLMASIPFASRYRLIDFTLSSMANSGIDTVSVVVNNNYQSLIDHLGSGRSWDLVRKNGGLNIFPPFADKASKPYVGRAGALANILDFLQNQKKKYVLLANSNIAANIDFKAMVDAHVASGADITMAYHTQEIPEGFLKAKDSTKGYYYTLRIDNGRVTKIFVNPKDTGIQNFCMNILIVDRELLINLVTEASLLGQEFLERDVLIPQLGKLNVQGYKYDGYVATISSIKTYFEENMRLLDDYNQDALFSGSPIYTKVRDDSPTRYIEGAKAQNVMVADGCLIEGEVENSILFRGVKVEKGAKVKNCILMQDTVVEKGADIEYLITDKNVTVTAGKEMKGTETYPVYIAKFHTV